jgi:uncharacterized membrane protein
MGLKNLKTNEQRVWKLLKSFLCFICVFCIDFAGCKSDSTPVTVQPRQEEIMRPNEKVRSENIVARQIEQLNKMDTNYIVKNNSRILTDFPEIKASDNITGDSRHSSRLAVDVMGAIVFTRASTPGKYAGT